MSLTLIDRPSPNFDARKASIDLVVLHYTGMQSAEIALARLTDAAPLAGRYRGPWQGPDIDPAAALGRVSAHYVVDEAGRIYRLVAEEARAWHAGVSLWEGRSDSNDRAIGVEIVNGGHDFGLPAFAEAQIEAVIALLQDLRARRRLHASRVVGHCDIAPMRKLDPGEHFPWRRLAEAGVALGARGEIARGGALLMASGAAGEKVAALQQKLARIGYGLEQSGHYDAMTKACVAAFQRRHRQDSVSGALDEETNAIIDDVWAQLLEVGA